MSIAPLSGMSFLPAQVVPDTTHRRVWTPPATASVPASALQGAGSTNAGSALQAGARTAAEQAFLFGLKIAFSAGDRASTARGLLRYAAGLSSADIQSDPALGSLVLLSQTIVANAKQGAGLFSAFG